MTATPASVEGAALVVNGAIRGGYPYEREWSNRRLGKLISPTKPTIVVVKVAVHAEGAEPGHRRPKFRRGC